MYSLALIAASLTSKKFIPFIFSPLIPKTVALSNNSFPAADLLTAVPMPYLLFSIMNNTGNSHNEAKLKASKTCPLLIAPSPT